MHDPLHGKLVVVIDDDPKILEAMEGLLRGWGCRVVSAASDAVALTALARSGQRPNLIISDYRLADSRSGIEAIESFRRRFDVAIPALLVSGDTEARSRAQYAGHDFLLKPADPTALRAVVLRLLDTP
jgi:CheY-like chemotaxis protein